MAAGGPARHRFVVAIDGPAASGKGTLASRIAGRFGFAHLDTGTLYRAVAYLVLSEGGDPADAAAAAAAAQHVALPLLSEPRLRGEAVARASSVVAAHLGVRQALLEFQQRFAACPPPPAPGVAVRGAVLDGRDIGSVVCPAADVKLYVTADAEVRAHRRLAELRDRGVRATYADVLRELNDRDARDAGRRAAPLRAPADAVIIDTTALDAEAVFALACDIVMRALAGSH